MRTSHLCRIGLIGAVLGLSLPAAAVQITLTTGRDTTLYSGAGLSNGQGQHFFAGQSGPAGGSRTLRALLQFDLAAALPVAARIDAASLTLVQTTPRFRGPATLSLHRVQRSWGEGSSIASLGEAGGAQATLGDATWEHAHFASEPWIQAGGDFDASALASASTLSAPLVLSSALLVADIQQALDDPAQHHGWLLKLTDEALAAYRFGSFQSASGPRLTIDYTVVPEPGSAALLALGLIALARGHARA